MAYAMSYRIMNVLYKGALCLVSLDLAGGTPEAAQGAVISSVGPLGQPISGVVRLANMSDVEME